VTLTTDGNAFVEVGTQDLGTGSYTVFGQLVAELLGLAVEKVKCRLGDTLLPPAGVSGGSSTVGSVGSAVKTAAEKLVAQLAGLAIADAKSALHGMKTDGIAIKNGKLIATDDASRSESVGDLLTRAGKKSLSGEGESKEGEAKKKFSMHAFGAVFMEVDVDPNFGTIRVRRATGAYAAGRVLNAKTARSQYLGGITFGIGTALLERTVTDHRTGRVVTHDLEGYMVPVNADLPAIDIIIVPEDDPHTNAIGTKGIGEIGNVGTAAAVANAVYHATGKRIRDFPITPESVL
jgi:xanthine dehydrogenase YagR molybdenum-binding subunit